MTLKKQLIIAATVFWICVLSVNLLRPHVPYNNTLRYKYLSDKVEWKNRFDIVIAGDSRVLIGISPGAMKRELPGYEIGNLGFIALIYSKDYLNYVRNALHSPVKNGVIVISFSPRSLLPKENGDCNFRKGNDERIRNERNKEQV